jgi:Domain of unknown function (DUF6362)
MTDVDWTPRLVQAFLEEAAVTARSIPEVRAPGFFNTWPSIKRSAVEIATMSARSLGHAAIPAACTRMDYVMAWLRWLDRDDQKLVWDRAQGIPWKIICHDRSINRSTAWRRWTVAIAIIAARLNGQCNNVATRQSATIRDRCDMGIDSVR